MDPSIPQPVAVLYQAAPAPPVDGVFKPMKEGGYSDSGADIAYTLHSRGIEIVTPNLHPNAASPFDWVWPDTAAGINAAIEHGASVLWANTVLFTGHPIARVAAPICIVGQPSDRSDPVEDKYQTNAMLLSAGLPAGRSTIVTAQSARGPEELALPALTPDQLDALGFHFPLVLKPIRGRGSQGVSVAANFEELCAGADAFFAARPGTHLRFGSRMMLEEFLPGEEITVAVLPPGCYRIDGRQTVKAAHWALPPVRRFNHCDGVAPYSGVVAVSANSMVMSSDEIADPHLHTVMRACELAANLLGAASVIRIDCRQSRSGVYKMFDANMKPNMTGPGRPGRDSQDSLVSLAAHAIGWSYGDLLQNILAQAWTATGPLAQSIAPFCTKASGCSSPVAD